MKQNTEYGLFKYMKEYRSENNGPALIFRDKVLTLGEFFDEIDRVQRFLAANGIKKGDTVCICLRNMPQIAVAIYAVNKAGAIANMVHAMNTPMGLKRLMEETDSKAIFIEDLFYDTYVPSLPEDTVTVVCNIADYDNGRPLGGECSAKLDEKGRKYFAYTELDGPELLEEVEVFGDDVCCYMHSGGTTGEPKTVALTNKNFNEMIYCLDDSVRKNFADEGEVAYTVLPMFHGFGLGFGLHTMMCWRCALIMVAQFDSSDVGRLVEQYKVSLLTGVPMMFKKLAHDESFASADLSSIKQAYCGGDALDPTTINLLNSVFENANSSCRICEGYGLTEAVSVVSTNRPEHIKNGTIGIPLEGVEVGIFDEEQNRLGADEIGEICVSAKTLMVGYHRDAKTSASIVFEGLDGKKWLKTGDLGSVDSDGFITFKGRKKRLIIISGYNVFPAEIEKLAKEVEGVRDACAVEGLFAGKPYVALFVETAQGANISQDEKKRILNYVSEWLPKWSRPAKIIGVDRMPLTQIGKVDATKLELLVR